MPLIEPAEVINLRGMSGGKNASAISFWKDRILVVADEKSDAGNLVQIFSPDGSDYRSSGFIELDEPDKPVEEMDLEGIAVEGQTVYVLGSHSATRKKVDQTKTRAENFKSLTSAAKPQPSRDVLIRVELDDDGTAVSIQRSNLRDILDSQEPFKSARSIASKENGVDAEGLTVFNSLLYIGFRGPVLRGNFTPVVRCTFDDPISDAEILFVNLDGLGIRELTRVNDGLLILAGPVGDRVEPFKIYFWNGEDTTPGSDALAFKLQLIGELEIPPSIDDGTQAKAEGLTLIKETNRKWEVLIVFDGLKNGHATRYAVPKPDNL